MPTQMTIGRALGSAGLAAGLVTLALQLVPYGRDHDNPAVVMEPNWDQPSTRELAARACFDCHSNETRWPWYSNVAPASWFVQRHVEDGRRVLNFSEWQRPQEEAHESTETLLEGEMPLGSYVLFHPSAQLSPSETRTLAQGLMASVGGAQAAHSDD